MDKGFFQHIRLPFCISGIFQQVMESPLKGIPGVVTYIDNIHITGAREVEYLHALKQTYFFRIVIPGLLLISLGKVQLCVCPVIKPAVQMLQIQEVHPGSHSNACNFLPFSSICFLYLSYLGHPSLLGLQTKTKR